MSCLFLAHEALNGGGWSKHCPLKDIKEFPGIWEDGGVHGSPETLRCKSGLFEFFFFFFLIGLFLVSFVPNQERIVTVPCYICKSSSLEFEKYSCDQKELQFKTNKQTKIKHPSQSYFYSGYYNGLLLKEKHLFYLWTFIWQK